MIRRGRAGFLKTAGAGSMTGGLPSAASTRTCSTVSPMRGERWTGARYPVLTSTANTMREISEEESLAIARETMEYEHAFLAHQIAFLECMHDWFTRHQSPARPENLRRPNAAVPQGSADHRHGLHRRATGKTHSHLVKVPGQGNDCSHYRGPACPGGTQGHG